MQGPLKTRESLGLDRTDEQAQAKLRLDDSTSTQHHEDHEQDKPTPPVEHGQSAPVDPAPNEGSIKTPLFLDPSSRTATPMNGISPEEVKAEDDATAIAAGAGVMRIGDDPADDTGPELFKVVDDESEPDLELEMAMFPELFADVSKQAGGDISPLLSPSARRRKVEGKPAVLPPTPQARRNIALRRFTSSPSASPQLATITVPERQKTLSPSPSPRPAPPPERQSKTSPKAPPRADPAPPLQPQPEPAASKRPALTSEEWDAYADRLGDFEAQLAEFERLAEPAPPIVRPRVARLATEASEAMDAEAEADDEGLRRKRRERKVGEGRVAAMEEMKGRRAGRGVGGARSGWLRSEVEGADGGEMEDAVPGPRKEKKGGREKRAGKTKAKAEGKARASVFVDDEAKAGRTDEEEDAEEW